jgi:heme oxygenase
MANETATVQGQDTFMDRLKQTTAAAHAATEEIPFNAAILSRTLPRENFAAQVKGWGELHQAVETALSASDHPIVQQVWGKTGARADLLRDDLTHLGTPLAAANAQAVTDEFEGWISSLAADSPVGLLGVLYVFEGSQLGGMILKKPLSEMYDLTDEAGLKYYSVHGKAIMGHWGQYKAAMNEAVIEPADQQAAIDASIQTFVYVGQLLECLSKDLPSTAS